jgi:hypothetical protein
MGRRLLKRINNIRIRSRFVQTPLGDRYCYKNQWGLMIETALNDAMVSSVMMSPNALD